MARPSLSSPSAVVAAEGSIFQAQMGLATREQLLKEGVSRGQVRAALAQGRWDRAAPGLYSLPSWPPSPRRRLLAACLATGGVASHASGAWVWDLLDEAPASPVVSVAHQRHGMLPGLGGEACLSGRGLEVSLVIHRTRDLPPASISERNGIPTTNPLRSLVDLAVAAKPATLDCAIDVALAKRLVSVESLLAEAGRRKRQGRRGPERLIAHLERRRFVGAAAPSVLESRALRLLADAGIKVLHCETKADNGRYRLDVELEHGVFLELDGYAYHWSPEQKGRDDARRNRLRLLGHEILVYDWRAVMEGRDGVLLGEVRAALRKQAPHTAGGHTPSSSC